MFVWSLQITIISIVLIFLIHHIIHFLKSTLTVPKIKDLVHSPLQKYEHIIQSMTAKESPSLIMHDRDAMKNELKSFLKNQLQKDSCSYSDVDTNTTEISALDNL